MATATTPATPTPPPPQTVTAALQAVLVAAQADLVAPDSTPDSQAAARTLIGYVQSALIRQAASLASAGAGAAPTVTVRGIDTVFSLAQQFLGDAARYREILDKNNLDFITVDVGSALLLPAA